MPDANAGQPAAAAASDALGRVKYAFVRGERDLYFVPADLTPTEKYKKVVRLLQAGVGRRAAAIIAEVVDGLFTNDSARDTSADVDPKAAGRDEPAPDPGASSEPEPG